MSHSLYIPSSIYTTKHAKSYLILTENIALSKPAVQSSTESDWAASRATDGDYNINFQGGHTCTHTTGDEHGWLVIDLQGNYDVGSVSITNRADCCCKISHTILHLTPFIQQ